jgi:hypothetical protein
LLETDGRKVGLHLRSFREVTSAKKLHPGDVAPSELPVAGDCVTVSLGPHEWADVEVRLTGKPPQAEPGG